MKLSLALTPRDYSVAGGAVVYDADAQAYFTANTAITSSADKNAINTFYLGLKSDGIYTKMKAMYLPIWGSATSSKWNLKDPRDLDAAFRLTFTNGWSFSSGGMTPLNAYANTKIIPNTTLSLNSTHISSYIRNSSQGVLLGTDGSSLPGTRLWISPNFNGTNRYVQINTNSTTPLTPINSNVGLWLGSRTSATVSKLYNNGSINYTSSESSSGLDLTEIILGARNTYPTISNYSTSQICFSSIGDGLTDAEASNLSNRVNTLMAYFGINTYPVVSDADAQAYINANDAITNQSDANAINTFFTGLKSDGIYTKIKAMYLPIWGSASASKWNLVNPLDTNAAFRLTFTTGWTFNSGGMTPNGTSAYARTEFSSYSQNSQHISYYSRTDSNTGVDLGNAVTGSAGSIYLYIRDTNTSYLRLNTTGAGTESSVTNTDGKGFYQLNRLASNKQTLFKNNTKNDFTVNSTGVPAGSLFLGGAQSLSSILYGNKQCSFSSIGDGLTDAEATNFYNRVQTLMTYFAINV